MARLVETVREQVVEWFERAYPDATRNDAWDWRVRHVGKGDTSEWTIKDWQVAHEVLRRKLGILVRPRADQRDQLGLGV